MDLSTTEELLCPICEQILRNPVTTECCYRNYCLQCITDWIELTKICKGCDQEITTADLETASDDIFAKIRRLTLSNQHQKEENCEARNKEAESVKTAPQPTERLRKKQTTVLKLDESSEEIKNLNTGDLQPTQNWSSGTCSSCNLVKHDSKHDCVVALLLVCKQQQDTIDALRDNVAELVDTKAG